MTREEVLLAFGTAQCAKGDACTHFDCVAERRMADEIVRLRSIAKAARAYIEALEGVIDAWVTTPDDAHRWLEEVVRDTPEREVSDAEP